ncbi:hypothetical protein [Bradyrhizobium lablabi]|uniref:hypothetical protein n=1 Tax=Bradyrhizobium lablabi TaxID=722472 RepID=UPI0012E3F72C|nr:hypothetical protein [Bradyrhizobium lablabi]
MDRTPFEAAIKAAIQKRIGQSIKILDRNVPNGVFAFERLKDSDAGKINWQEVAVELARATNLAVLFIGHTWTLEGPDSTSIAFDFSRSYRGLS